VVRRTAADHGGSFAIGRHAGRNAAVIVLPLRPEGSAG
jgi:hypothetical protein